MMNKEICLLYTREFYRLETRTKNINGNDNINTNSIRDTYWVWDRDILCLRATAGEIRTQFFSLKKQQSNTNL